jgi:uncharacterized membrane protein
MADVGSTSRGVSSDAVPVSNPGPEAGSTETARTGPAASGGAGTADHRSALPRLAPWLLAVVMSAAYGAVSIRRHLVMKTTSFDLGIFEQGVRSYAHLHWPTSALKAPGYPLLGDHFSPILAVLAPFYRIAPSAITLLAAQALLCGISVLPITALAIRILGLRAGTAVGISYGISWGIQNTIVFDFHEISFAVPILAFSMCELVKRNLRSAVLIALPLVLVKEDLPLTLAAIGVCVFIFGNRRWGVVTAAAGVALSALIILVVIPAFNPDGHNNYLTSAAGPGLVSRLVTEGGTIAALLVLSAFLCVRSPLLLVAIPTLAWRFTSNNELYWGTRFHYSAVLMPIVFAAFLDVLQRYRSAGPDGWQRFVPKAAVAVSLTASLALGCTLCLSDLVRPATWHTSPAVIAEKRLLRRVPDGAVIAAPNRFGPQLTNRATVLLYPWYPSAATKPDWVLAEGHPRGWPYTPEQKAAGLTPLTNSGQYSLVDSAGDLYLFRKIG